MIETDALVVDAGGFTLRGVTLQVCAGEHTMVLGEAGSGKTTLLEAIAGVRRATSGCVRLRGADMTAVPPEGRRVGIVYQHSYLFPHLSVQENIAYGTRDVAAWRAAAERTGADRLAGRAVGGLSGGERQLVALARALAPGPDVLLLDEPFAALDRRRRAAMRDTVGALRRERPALAVLEVSHDVPDAVRRADRLLVLHDGVVVQQGTPAELRAHPASPLVAELLADE